MKRSNLIIALAALAILAGGGVAVWRSQSVTRAPEASDIGGPFQLTNQAGAKVDQRVLKGKWSAVYFGYTFCPDVCPTTLAALAQAIGGLGAKGGTLQVVFITIDPQRDTPAQLRSYLASPSFPKEMIGLTGTAEEIKSAAGAYRVYYSRQGDGADYSVDHTSIIYLMNPQGRFVRPIASGAPADMANQIAAAMSGH